MTMLMALLLAAVGPDPDGIPTLADPPLPTSLAAEERISPEQEEVRREREATPKFLLSLGLEGRWTTPWGSANHSLYYVDNPNGGLTLLFNSNLRWNDLFRAGWGTSLIGEVTFVQAGRAGGSGRGRGKFSAGAYVNFSQDHYSGDSVNDGFGNSFSVDNLDVTSYLVGLTVYQDMGEGVFLDARAGVGAVHFSRVDADYRFNFQPAFRGAFLQDSWNFASEFRGGTGYRFGQVALTLGVGLRLFLPPDEASTVKIDAGMFLTFDVDLGLEIGF
ncbi:MAG: hypothetical protein JO332_16355 [Planctomycetaceae bacterium]|nr:hypothetical protein [Planctomycetaceae bacterium]